MATKQLEERWISTDGKKFTTKEECEKHEKNKAMETTSKNNRLIINRETLNMPGRSGEKLNLKISKSVIYFSSLLSKEQKITHGKCYEFEAIDDDTLIVRESDKGWPVYNTHRKSGDRHNVSIQNATLSNYLLDLFRKGDDSIKFNYHKGNSKEIILKIEK